MLNFSVPAFWHKRAELPSKEQHTLTMSENLQPSNNPPSSIEELLSRARQLSGHNLGELADMANIAMPTNFRKHKGFTGQLIELWLGASAGSKPQQDFPELGVELKTIPISCTGQPLETTYVCYAPLQLPAGSTWENSNVRNKLRCVLWVPIEGERTIPVAQRRVATAFLWSPSPHQLAALANDWNELTEMILTGRIENITSRVGDVMQLRPKAANGKVLTEAIGEEGQRILTRPRGFYLRKAFTQEILSDAFF